MKILNNKHKVKHIIEQYPEAMDNVIQIWFDF